MRLGPLLLVGCYPPDPQLEAWHGPIEVNYVQQADGSCDAPFEPIDPPEPWLFVAVDRGLPDIASLYWCPGPESCSAPFGTVWLKEFTETRLTGDLTSVTDFEDGGLCATSWDDLVADQDEGVVSLTWRQGLTLGAGLTYESCLALGETALGSSCEVQLRIDGIRP